MSFRSLSKDELAHEVKKHAMLLAYTAYQNVHPGTEPEQAHKFAERHWSEFEEKALDLLATWEAMEESGAVLGPAPVTPAAP